MEVRFTKNRGMICTKWRYNSSKTEVRFAKNGGTITTNRLIHLINMPVSSLEFDRTEKKYVKYIFLKPTHISHLFTPPYSYNKKRIITLYISSQYAYNELLIHL